MLIEIRFFKFKSQNKATFSPVQYVIQQRGGLTVYIRGGGGFLTGCSFFFGGGGGFLTGCSFLFPGMYGKCPSYN